MRYRALLSGGVLLGLLVLAADGCADEIAAIKAVKKMGGQVEVDAQRPGKPVVAVNLLFAKVTVAGLKELKQLKSLHTLGLCSTQVADAQLKELKELKSLRTLKLKAWFKRGPFQVTVRTLPDPAGTDRLATWRRR